MSNLYEVFQVDDRDNLQWRVLVEAKTPGKALDAALTRHAIKDNDSVSVRQVPEDHFIRDGDDK